MTITDTYFESYPEIWPENIHRLAIMLLYFSMHGELMSIPACQDAPHNGTLLLSAVRIAHSALMYRQARCASNLQLTLS